MASCWAEMRALSLVSKMTWSWDGIRAISGQDDNIKLGSDEEFKLVIKDGIELGSDNSIELGIKNGMELGSGDGIEIGIKDGIELE
eukprot:7902734-Ditylum_brightwellii.AAC.1